MGIQRLQIEGFRSLRDVSWEPGRLNVVIGPNGSGKSNLLRALGFLRHASTGELPQEVLRQGGIGPLLWDASVAKIEWNLRTDLVGVGRDPIKEALTYQLALRQLGSTSTYRIEHEVLSKSAAADTREGYQPLKFLDRTARRAVTFDVEERALTAHAGSVADDQTLLSLVAGPFGNPVILAFRDRLASWCVYHDLRVDQQAPIRQAAVARIEKRVAADGQNLIPVLHTLYTSDRDFKRALDAAMRAALGQDFEELVFPPAADQRVQLRIRWQPLKTEQSAADLSDGTIRFLLLIAILASPSPGDLIAMDEPETGLHPGMFPIVAELAAQAAERTQVVLTTHSPQLLDAFTQFAQTTSVTAWESGQTRLSVIEGEELHRWLQDYSLGTLFRSGELEAMA